MTVRIGWKEMHFYEKLLSAGKKTVGAEGERVEGKDKT